MDDSELAALNGLAALAGGASRVARAAARVPRSGVTARPLGQEVRRLGISSSRRVVRRFRHHDGGRGGGHFGPAYNIYAEVLSLVQETDDDPSQEALALEGLRDIAMQRKRKTPVVLVKHKRFTPEAAQHARREGKIKRLAAEKKEAVQDGTKKQDQLELLGAHYSVAAKCVGVKWRRLGRENPIFTTDQAKALVIAGYQQKPVHTLGVNIDRLHKFMNDLIIHGEFEGLMTLFRGLAEWRRARPGNRVVGILDHQFDGTTQPVSNHYNKLMGTMGITCFVEVMVQGGRFCIHLLPEGSQNVTELTDRQTITDPLSIYIV